MRILKQLGMMTSVLGMISAAAVASAQSKPADADNFYKSKNVIVRAVIFKNQYKMTVAGNLFLPTGMDQTAKRAAITVGHPMGAVKEQLKAMDARAVMIENCGMPEERIYRSVEEIPDNAGYYSLIIVKEASEA